MLQISAITESRLFALLRISLFNNKEDMALFANMSDKEWLDVYNLALDHGVLAFAYDGVGSLDAELGPELELKIQWAYNVAHIEKIFKRQHHTAHQLVNTFCGYGITTVILKGLSNAAMYHNPAHRQAGDIDIYLMGDYAKGNDIIKSQGINIKYDFFVHSEFRLNGINIENHLFFVNPNINKTGRYIQETLRSITKDDLLPHPIIKGAYTLPLESAALFFIRHSSWHYAREGIKLRDICDWAMFLDVNGKNIDCKKLNKMLSESGLLRYAAILTHIAVQYLGISSYLEFEENIDQIAAKVKNDILTFDNSGKRSKKNFIQVFITKISNRISRKWCYDEVVPDSYWGNIWYSIMGYIKSPLAIFKAKL